MKTHKHNGDSHFGNEPTLSGEVHNEHGGRHSGRSDAHHDLGDSHEHCDAEVCHHGDHSASHNVEGHHVGPNHEHPRRHLRDGSHHEK